MYLLYFLSLLMIAFNDISPLHGMHLNLKEDDFGISGLFKFSPKTAAPMRALAHELLYEEHSLSRGDRELIASYVSCLNGCYFCSNSHAAIAACYFDNNDVFVHQVMNNPETAPISNKLKKLLSVARCAQKSGKEVTTEIVADARKHGATDKEIHDTVLITAAFCMFNRYVDGLGAWAPTDQNTYRSIGLSIKNHGYIRKD